MDDAEDQATATVGDGAVNDAVCPTEAKEDTHSLRTARSGKRRKRKKRKTREKKEPLSTERDSTATSATETIDDDLSISLSEARRHFESDDEEDMTEQSDAFNVIKGMSLHNSDGPCPSFPLAKVSEEEFSMLRHQFEKMDVNKEGKLTKEQFTRAMGFFSTNEVDHNVLIDLLFDKFDEDGDGFVSYTEFLLSLSIMTKGSKSQKLEFAFNIIDRDKDGAISKEEFTTILEGMYSVLRSISINVPGDISATVDRIFASLDLDHDGKITLKEYKKGAQDNKLLLQGLGLLQHEEIDPLELRNSGVVVTFGHTNWQLVMSMMIGMRQSVLTAQTNQPKALLPKHFMQKEAITVQSDRYTGLSGVFTDYAPHVFSEIRNLSGISNEEYMLSLGPEQLLGNILLGSLSSMTMKISAGKSGSFFYTSHDGRYLVKTVLPKEKATLKRLLPEYYEHLLNNPDSLISRILGFHKIGDIPFIVMSNVFDTTLEIHDVYDLKGSEIGRTNTTGSGPLKDLDFKRKIILPDDIRQRFLEQIESDSKSINIIDYSLLLGIHYKDKAKNCRGCRKDVTYTKFYQQEQGGIASRDPNEIYFVGIIDVLTCFGFRKKGESIVRYLISAGGNVSTVPPPEYSQRFIAYMHEIAE